MIDTRLLAATAMSIVTLEMTICRCSTIAAEKSYCATNKLGYAYNFTGLTAEFGVVEHRNYDKVRVNLCSPLERCDGKEGYSVCLETRENGEKGIGKSPPESIPQKNGKLEYKFIGDACTSSSENYTTNVILECDYSATNNSSPVINPHFVGPCKLHIVWKTAAACRDRRQTNCAAVDKNNNRYDLSPLTKFSDNYVVKVDDDESQEIILNVCHSVIYGYRALCQTDSGVCLKVSTNSGIPKYLNLGDINSPPSFDAQNDTLLKIEYEPGIICSTNNDMPHVKTTIYFQCDPTAIDTEPDYVGGSKDCHYKLIWRTSVACSEEILRNRSLTKDRCAVRNPITNFEYNLQSLTKLDVRANNSQGLEYSFRVCKANANKTCKSANAGICDSKNGTSAGEANSNLIWRQGGPYLNYTNGEVCEDGLRRYTLIAFFCGPEDTTRGPLIMRDEPCYLVIHWNTELVCENKINCMTDDKEIDLTSLRRSDGNYVVKTADTEFRINVCQALVPVQDLTCLPGAAACKTIRNATGQFTQETSLGFPEDSPRSNNDTPREASLEYRGGSQCPESPDTSISSKLIFLCDYEAGRGTPEFERYVNCTYVFKWKTSIVCGAVMRDWAPPCGIKLPSGVFDMSSLHKKGAYYVKNKQSNYDYVLNICGGQKHCNGSAVCLGSAVGYGSLANVVFDYTRNVIKLKYSNDVKCINSTYSSEIRLVCNASAGIGEPKLILDSQCTAVFVWETSVTCTPQTNANDSSQITADTKESEKIKEQYPTIYAGVLAAIMIFIAIVVGAFMCMRSPKRREQLNSCINSVTLPRSNGSRVQYYRVNTTEEARLLLDYSDPTHCETDSDDELLGA